MKQEGMFLIALVVIALLASIPQVPVDAQIWGALLAIVGVVSAIVVNYQDIMQRIVIYVVALALPTIDNCLNAIWVVGPWLNMFLDNVALGIQGAAIGMFVMALIGRIQGGPQAASS